MTGAIPTQREHVTHGYIRANASNVALGVGSEPGVIDELSRRDDSRIAASRDAADATRVTVT